jgi:O-antigen/teichoic acid export membrane protein
MEYYSVGYILNSLLILVGVIWGMLNYLDLYFFAMIYIISNGVVLLYYVLVYLWKFQRPHFEFSPSFCKKTLIEALPLSLATIFALIHFRVDTILLSIINGDIAVGLYSASYRVLEMLNFIPIIFTTAIFPVLSQLHVSSKESLDYSYQVSFKFILIVALPISASIALLAPQIILLIYSTGYQPSILILQILIWSIPALFLSYLFGTTLTSINQQKLLFRAIIISTVLNIVMNLILLPYYSYLGAAVTTLISESVLCIIYYYFISKHLEPINFRAILPKPVIATIIICLIIYYLNLNYYLSLNLLLLIPFLILVYIALLFLFRTFTPEEIEIMKKAF